MITARTGTVDFKLDAPHIETFRGVMNLASDRLDVVKSLPKSTGEPHSKATLAWIKKTEDFIGMVRGTILKY